jgi:hypothetical protein
MMCILFTYIIVSAGTLFFSHWFLLIHFIMILFTYLLFIIYLDAEDRTQGFVHTNHTQFTTGSHPAHSLDFIEFMISFISIRV